mgnify:CR=1 FL=1
MKGDVPVSAQLSLHFNNKAYLLIGGNDPNYRDTGNSTFIILSSIKDAFDNGISEIDFVGVNSPNRGDFKLSFNSVLRPYYKVELTGPSQLFQSDETNKPCHN